MGNRLEREQSPYLLQHANNPVDWYPWGPEALDRARREDKPVLVSIGYSACHWCHVMEHESFEDEATAQIMNDNFVNIKVDREERPDVDAVYMEAVQALTGQGGWPLNVFLTPDRRPFFGGTYFPPSAVHGMPSWTDVLQGIAQTYQEKREDVLHNADVLANYIAQAQRRSGSSDPIEPELLLQAYESIERQFDRERGGFGASPKFPQPLSLEFVLRAGRRFHDEAAQAFVLMTLQRMAAGGIYDQLGGGFHRYAVDANWVVPHFEKMLYDNALLASVYTNAYQLTKNMRFRAVAEETLDYMLRDLRSPHGGFYSSQDADSEGVEGKFYVWTRDQLVDILGEHDADLAAKRYGVTEAGNFQGATILTLAASDQELYDTEGGREVDLFERLRRIRATLLSARTQRIPPSTDTKILLGWNALGVRALAHAGRSLGREDYIDAAEATVAFLLHELCPAGRMVRSYRAGPGSVDAFLEDYAYLLESLLVLYESTFRSRYLQQARKLADEMIERFHDDAQGAFFDTPEQETTLFVRPRGFFDNPIPSGNSSACFGLLRLEALTGESKFRDAALEVFRAVREVIGQAPLGFSHLLSALDFYLSTPAQIVIVGAEEDPDTGALVRCVSERYLPNSVMAAGQGDGSPLFAGKRAIGGRPTAFVCEHFSCHSPVTTVEELTAQLERL